MSRAAVGFSAWTPRTGWPWLLLASVLSSSLWHCSDDADPGSISTGNGGRAPDGGGAGVGGATPAGGRSGAGGSIPGTGYSGTSSTSNGGMAGVEPGDAGVAGTANTDGGSDGGMGSGGTDPGGAGGDGAASGAGTGGDAGSGAGAVGGSGTGGSATGGSGDAGAGGGGVEPVNQIPFGVGTPCNVDADCPTTPTGAALLTCLTSESNAAFGTGGPQGGYCSAPCEQQPDCDRVDSVSACLELPGGDFCIGLCTPGPGEVKCGADRARACVALAPEVGACLPVCTSDSACGPGRFCSAADGLCVDTPPPGGGLGAPCSLDTETSDCASGVCLTFTAPGGEQTEGFCSQNCAAFAPIGCGFDALSEGPREGACLQPQLPDGAPGDIGFCFELCDVDADCAQEDWLCSLFVPEDAAVLGRLGQCVPPELAADLE